MSVTGDPAGEPMKVGVALVDVLAGLFATVGILAALRHREASGEGQLVEVDLFSALLAAMVNQGSAYTIAGVVPQRLGNRHPSISPYEVYDTAEGELVLAIGNDRQFANLCDELGEPELAADPRFATNPARVEHREALGVELVRLLAARPADDWAAALLARRVPAGQVNDLGSAFAFAERSASTDRRHPSRRRRQRRPSPATRSASPPPPRPTAPHRRPCRRTRRLGSARFSASSRSAGRTSAANWSRKRFWSWPGAWRTRSSKPSST